MSRQAYDDADADAEGGEYSYAYGDEDDGFDPERKLFSLGQTEIP